MLASISSLLKFVVVDDDDGLSMLLTAACNMTSIPISLLLCTNLLTRSGSKCSSGCSLKGFIWSDS